MSTSHVSDRLCDGRWRRLPLLGEKSALAEAILGLMTAATAGLLDDVSKIMLVPGILIVAHGLAGWRRAETPNLPPGTEVTAFRGYPVENAA